MHYKLDNSDIREWMKKNPSENVFYVPENIVSIDNRTFADCPQLKKVVLPLHLSQFGDDVFENSNNIETISFIGGNKKSYSGQFVIENGYLYDFFNKRILKVFSQAKTVEIPEGVECLERLCFAGLKNLKTVVLPSSVKSMESPFAGCNALQEIIVKDDNEFYSAENNCLYEKKKKILERVVTSSDEFIVPEYIRNIKAFSFPECVERIQISNKLNKINVAAGENPLLKKWIKEWKHKQTELKNEIKRIVDFDFSLSSDISGNVFFEVFKNDNELYRGKILFEQKIARYLVEQLEKILGSKINCEHITFKTPGKSDVIFVIENHGEKFTKIRANLKDSFEKTLVLVSAFIPDSNGKYKECSRITYKMDFVKKLYFLVSNKYPEVKSNLLETIMEMNNLDAYYERVE